MTPPRFRTKLLRVTPALAALGIAVVVAACSNDAPTSATSSQVPSLRKEIIAPPQTATVLKRTKPLTRDYTASVVVGPTGGAINIPEAGFHLNIPKASLYGSRPITITVTALAGDEVAYKFSPHGLKFAKAISATQDLEFTTWNGHEGNDKLEAVYFADDSLLNVVTGTVTVAEVFPTNMVASGQRVHWGVPHFSGYVIATGRTSAY